MASSSTSKTNTNSAYDAFSSVDQLVAKPVLGSDGAANWQSFRQTQKGSGKNVAPTAPLKANDRALFSSWQQERAHEQVVRKEAGDHELNPGYTHFREKHDPTMTKKETKRIEKRIRPDDQKYYLASKTFQGHKFDYVFTTRAEYGTGYFWDGMDSVKRLRGEEVLPTSAPQKIVELKRIAPPTEDTLEDHPLDRKKKRKKDKGPIIVETPNNPLDQVAAVLRQRQQHGLLPTGWESSTDTTSGKMYYYCRTTGERQWEKPLPDGWSKTTDPSTGKDYYYNGATNETRWEMPTS